MIRTVLFDLDGTLLDTAPDLAYALNRVLREQGRPILPLERIRPVVSHGTVGLLRVGFGLQPDDEDFAPLRRRLLDLYQEHLARDTRPFPGIEQLLAGLERAGLRWGVVTNKPGWLTEPLLQQLGLTPRSACIVSGDTTARRKPDPEPLLHACTLAGCLAPECVYVGDAERDVIAGRAAGMRTIVAAYGYIEAHDNPLNWGGDHLVHEPGEILAWLEQHNGATVPPQPAAR
jgi:2-phosphoglycolate phosphatase